MEEAIINRVAKSGIETIDLAQFFPVQEIVVLDIKAWLFHGLILKEKDFRQYLEEHDWAQYTGKAVCMVCTADAIIPLWAYMLVAAKLQPFTNDYIFGNRENYLSQHYAKTLVQEINPADFAEKRIVIKGCADKDVSESAYVEITRLLLPVAKTIMFGEPCSTVPVFKKAKS
ncbi:MAG: DUF2480 family protein [Sphingobacteriales bacterium]|nr:MAG: DUF2480 family protein [Sphingobacteriales bacterium]